VSPQRQVTIAAIAAEIGVSVPTVSKVLNGRADVAPATRQRVERALEDHQYRRPRTGTKEPEALIDLVFHDIGSAWSMEIIQGVQRAAAGERLGVVLWSFGGSHHPSPSWVEAVFTRRPRGAILVMSTLDPTQRHQLESRNIPFVIVDTDGETPPDVATVGSNNWHGGLSATRHLLQLGHRRLAAIGGPQDVLCSRARMDGFRTAHDELGLAVDPAFVRYGDFVLDGGYHHGRDLLSRADRPTAIFAGSDMQAMGVLRAAQELGLSVPGDVSLVGYDDLPLAAWMTPALTTVHQPLLEMAETATRIVLEHDRSMLRPPRVELATHLVVRESTAPPRAT